MTQTIDQRARELLAKHLGVSKIASCWPGENALCHADAALAALTEALSRIEELEGALRPFAAASSVWKAAIPDDVGLEVNLPSPCAGSYPADFTLGDLRRASALTKGIKE